MAIKLASTGNSGQQAFGGLVSSPDVLSPGARLRREREAAGLTRPQLVDRMKEAGYLSLTSDENVVRYIQRWEAGDADPNRAHQQILARVFGLATLTLFAPPPSEPQWADIDVGETLTRIARSDVTAETLNDLRSSVDRLCTAYSTDDPRVLIGDASRWLVEIDTGLAGRVSATQTQEMMDAAAWLSLLLGCLVNDLGDRAQADRMRVTAGRLARDAGNERALAWSHEMRVWFALTDGELHEAVVASDAGIAVAPRSDVAVQLWGQQAEAWARLGDPYQARKALESARVLLDELPWPDNPRNHFSVDPPKFRKSKMRLARLLGEQDTAVAQAETIITEGLRPDGTHRQPMRVADAMASLACVAAEAGDVGEAVRLAHEAIDVPRVSIPSLRQVVCEAVELLPPSDTRVRELAGRVRAL